jgi:hypothetical protein
MAKKKDDDFDLPVYDEEFPTDDEYSLQELAGGSAPRDLNIFYGHQFVQDEEVTNDQPGTECHYRLAHKKVVAMSVVGSVWHNGNKVQSFMPLTEETFGFTSYPYDGPKVVSAKMNRNLLALTWDRKIKAGSSKVVVSYEYDAD